MASEPLPTYNLMPVEETEQPAARILSCASCAHWHQLRAKSPFGQCMLSARFGTALAIVTPDKASCSGWTARPE